MKPMKYPNSDLGMWHTFAEVAEHLKFVAEAEEQRLYSQCEFYSYDDHAFEEYCNHPEIKRNKDFVAKDECWKCKFFCIPKKEKCSAKRS